MSALTVKAGILARQHELIGLDIKQLRTMRASLAIKLGEDPIIDKYYQVFDGYILAFNAPHAILNSKENENG